RNHPTIEVYARTMNEGNGWTGSGANPWHLDKNTESILFLTDEGDQPARIGFSVTAGGVHYYLTSLKLAAHETRAIDLRKLRDAQVPDYKGHKIPAGAVDGSVNWVRMDDVPVSHSQCFPDRGFIVGERAHGHESIVRGCRSKPVPA
ncbi:MAG: hypothetical protein P8Z30_17075, partial [Acidobacteriota bacterium]